MTRITEPHWGRPVGRVDRDGNVTIDVKFADVMRALVKNLATTAATANAAAESAATPSSPVSITGPNVTGDAVHGYVISAPDSAGAVPLSIGEDESYTVAANTQTLYHEPIDVDGELVIDGVLAEV